MNQWKKKRNPKTNPKTLKQTNSLHLFKKTYFIVFCREQRSMPKCQLIASVLIPSAKLSSNQEKKRLNCSLPSWEYNYGNRQSHINHHLKMLKICTHICFAACNHPDPWYYKLKCNPSHSIGLTILSGKRWTLRWKHALHNSYRAALTNPDMFTHCN